MSVKENDFYQRSEIKSSVDDCSNVSLSRLKTVTGKNRSWNFLLEKIENLEKFVVNIFKL